MTARSPRAFFLSALFHAAVAGLVFLATMLGSESKKEEPKIIELVAGEGDNYAANVAPALGTPGIKVSLPVAPVLAPEPAVEPTPVQAAPVPPPQKSPVTPASEPPAPKPAPEKKPVPSPQPNVQKVPDFAQQVKRVAAQKAARLEAQYKRQLAAERERQAKAEKAAQDAAAKAKRIDAEGIRNGVVGGSKENTTGGAGGKALTREETSLMDSYFAYLKAKVKENHEKPEGLSDTLVATVQFHVAADGSLSGAKIVKSSRSSEFDKSVLDAIRRTKSIGKRHDGRGDDVLLEFKMRDEDSDGH